MSSSSESSELYSSLSPEEIECIYTQQLQKYGTVIYCSGDDCGCKPIDYFDNKPFDEGLYRDFIKDEDWSEELIKENIEYYLSQDHLNNNRMVGVETCLECKNTSQVIEKSYHCNNLVILCLECFINYYYKDPIFVVGR